MKKEKLSGFGHYVKKYYFGAYNEKIVFREWNWTFPT